MKRIGIFAVALLLGACASNSEDMSLSADDSLGDSFFEDMMSGGRFKGAALDAALKAAEKHPMGSEKNPVRADMPEGQRAYLQRLRCANGKPPNYQRAGNIGPGVFGSIVDLYEVRCDGSTPAEAEVYMDMYFPGHVEQRTVPGFLLTP